VLATATTTTTTTTTTVGNLQANCREAEARLRPRVDLRGERGVKEE
jgi:hypothetical protein